MRAMHSIIILCFDSKLQLHDLPRTLRDAFYIINQTFCPLIIVLASRVIRPHLCVSCCWLLRPLVHTLSDLLLWSWFSWLFNTQVTMAPSDDGLRVLATSWHHVAIVRGSQTRAQQERGSDTQLGTRLSGPGMHVPFRAFVPHTCWNAHAFASMFTPAPWPMP